MPERFICAVFVLEKARGHKDPFCPILQINCCHFCPKADDCPRVKIRIRQSPCIRCLNGERHSWINCEVRVNKWDAFYLAISPTDKNLALLRSKYKNVRRF